MHHIAAALRPARLSLLLAFSLLLVACGGSGAASDHGNGGGSGGGTAAVENGRVEIVADDIAFDVATIEAPAGEAFTVTLLNAEAEPHNVSIYTEEGGEVIVKGRIITGPGQTVDVEVPALEPGEYFFVCDVHLTEMTGTLVVEG